jgi:hypothetical protein
VEDQGIAFVLSTPFTIRTLQRNLSRKAKPESGPLDTGACLLRKNIGKPCMGKPYARFDEGALGYPLSAVVRSRRVRRNVREQLQVNTSALLYLIPLFTHLQRSQLNRRRRLKQIGHDNSAMFSHRK